MNDLADNEKPAVLENFPGRISEIDRALDAVAKAELLREQHRDVGVVVYAGAGLGTERLPVGWVDVLLEVLRRSL